MEIKKSSAIILDGQEGKAECARNAGGKNKIQ